MITAFLGSVTIFACFTGASLLARRREYLFLGGILSSALSTLVMLKFCSFLFGGGVALFNLEVQIFTTFFLQRSHSSSFRVLDIGKSIREGSNVLTWFFCSSMEGFYSFLAMCCLILK